MMQSQSIECAICSERFRNSGGETSDFICVTPCGHVYHECCISEWLSGRQTNTCPECREIVTVNDLRRIFFNFAPSIENTQAYIEVFEKEIIAKVNKNQRIKLQNMKLKNDLSEKDNEIQRLIHDQKKLKNDFSNKLSQKDIEIHKLKHELHKLMNDLPKSLELINNDTYKLHTNIDIKNNLSKNSKSKKARTKLSDVQMYQLPVDMSAHNSNVMQTAIYHQNQASTSAMPYMDYPIPSASGISTKSSTFITSNNADDGVTQCHSDTSTAHSSRQLYPSNDDQNATDNGTNLSTMYERNPYLYQQRLALASPHRQLQIAQAFNQSSMLQNNYIAWMTNGNSPMLMSTNDTAPQPNFNYQPNLFLQQPQSQQSNNIISTNVLW